jgi:hypothetical protein
MLWERRAVKKNFRTTETLNYDIKQLLKSKEYEGYSEGDLINLALENLISASKIQALNLTTGGKKMKAELKYEDKDGRIIVESAHLVERISRIIKAVDLAYATDKTLYIMHPAIFDTKAGEEAYRLIITYATTRDIWIAFDGWEGATAEQEKEFIENVITNKISIPGWAHHLFVKEKQKYLNNHKEK